MKGFNTYRCTLEVFGESEEEILGRSHKNEN